MVKIRPFFIEGDLMSIIIIGVGGASGSGKTSVAVQLFNYYGPDKCTIISSDNYYKGKGSSPLEKRHEINFDHPDSIDFELLASHLRLLKLNHAVRIPTYDFSTSSRKEETLLITPKQIIIVEGILVLHPKEITDLLDTKIFVNAEPDICFIRRLERDMKDRGRTPTDVILQYKKTVKPMFEQFVGPCMDDADLVLENSTESSIGEKGVPFDMKPVTDFVSLSIAGPKYKAQQRFKLFSSSSSEVFSSSSSEDDIPSTFVNGKIAPLTLY